MTQERATNHKPIELSPPIALDCIALLHCASSNCIALHCTLFWFHFTVQCATATALHCNCNGFHFKCCILLSCLESPLRTMRRFILLILNSHFQSHIMLHCIVLHYFALHCTVHCYVRLVCTLPSIPPWYWRHTSSVLSGVGLPLTRLALLLIPPPTQIGSCLHFAEAPLRCRGTAEAKFYPFLWQNEPWVANHIVVSQGTLWPTNGSRWPVLKPLPRSKMWYLPNSSESYDLSITCQWLVPWPGLWLWSSWKIGLSGPLYSHSS